jgi:sec-independent protein translocase protein TatC
MISGDKLDQKNQTLMDHLVELRDRIIYVGYALIIGTGICYSFSEKIFNIIRGPITPYLQGGGLIYTGPLDKFMAHIKISFLGGFILTCPIWIYQIWKFIAPGLYKKEKRYIAGFIASGTLLFLIGVSFSYFIVFPMAFKFLMTFGGDVDKPMITIAEYLSFFLTTTLMFGASFEMPLIISILGMMGIVSQKFLKEKRRYAIMGLAILSAIITPPDLLSMLMMLIPLVILYEISVLVVGFFERKKEESLK